MNKYKVDFSEMLVFMLGFFSTFELLRVFGITVFSVLLMIFSTYMILIEKKIFLKKRHLYIGIYMGIVTISELMIFTIQLTNKSEWILSSVKKYILLMFLVCSFLFISKLKEGKKLFIKGLYCSCLIEMIWCYLQFGLYSFFNININQILFGVSQSSAVNGNLVLSGLNSNAGILAPALFFLILYENRMVIRLLTLILFFISGTSSMLICGITILLVLCVNCAYNRLRQERILITKKMITAIMVVIIVAVLIITIKPTLIHELNDSVTRLFSRLSDAKTANFTDGSTFTHTRYYTSIPYIIKNSNVLNILFGYGIDCAGVPFVHFFGQYKELIYVPESDAVTFLYNYGVVGVVIIYFMIFYAVLNCKKSDWRYGAFLCSVVVGGIFYGMYLNWVLLFTWLIIDEEKENQLNSCKINIS